MHKYGLKSNQIYAITTNWHYSLSQRRYVCKSGRECTETLTFLNSVWNAIIGDYVFWRISTNGFKICLVNSFGFLHSFEALGFCVDNSSDVLSDGLESSSLISGRTTSIVGVGNSLRSNSHHIGPLWSAARLCPECENVLLSHSTKWDSGCKLLTFSEPKHIILCLNKPKAILSVATALLYEVLNIFFGIT